ncbi:MAG TPA: aminotransferase class V-fold PLP-dependent enzyme, partial [Verrucomicrobiae bacterium]|nr:aminotransferase class V-fold PLP-dependent enzyme [Verrucomicrobiae bacterium]
YKSEVTTRVFEETRQAVLKFVRGNQSSFTAIFLKNTTEGINKLSYRLRSKNAKTLVLATGMEHHSNDLPWRNKYKVEYVNTDSLGRLCLEDLDLRLSRNKGKVKLVAVTGASNVTGYVNPVHQIAAMAHGAGAEILVDGAQLIPHSPFSMGNPNSPDYIDYLVFSAHKMYAPFGSGVLIGPNDTFAQGDPEYSGGGTIQGVTHDLVLWADPPHRDEAGTPNIMGVLALNTALQTLSAITMQKVFSWELKLADYALKSMRTIPNLIIYAHPGQPQAGIAVIPFNINGIHHKLTARILADEAGIATRSGCFCAQPYVHKLLGLSAKEVSLSIRAGASRPGMVRISFGLYNTFQEVNIFLECLARIANNRQYFLSKYSGITLE